MFFFHPSTPSGFLRHRLKQFCIGFRFRRDIHTRTNIRHLPHRVRICDQCVRISRRNRNQQYSLFRLLLESHAGLLLCKIEVKNLLKGECHEILYLNFFYKANPSGPLINRLKRFFLKISFREDIRI